MIKYLIIGLIIFIIIKYVKKDKSICPQKTNSETITVDEHSQRNKEQYALKYERFVCELYKQKGYNVEHIGGYNNKTSYEKIDIIAKKDDKIVLIECKYWVSEDWQIDYKLINELYGKYNFYLNENNLNRKNTSFLIVSPKNKNTLKGKAPELLKKNKNVCKYERVNFLSNNFKLIAGIIEKKYKCWKCNEDTSVIAIKFYNNYNGYENDTIIKNIKELSEELLFLIQKKFPKYCFYTNSNGESYFANKCNSCNIIQGEYYLYNTNIFNDKSKAKYFIALDEETQELKYIAEKLYV